MPNVSFHTDKTLEQRSRVAPKDHTHHARLAIRFSVTFLALVGVMSGAVLVDELALESAGALTLTSRTAAAVGSILQASGLSVAIDSNYIHYQATTFQIIPECTGVEVIGLFVAAVFAFPSRWRHKLVGLAVGLPLLVVLNLIRIMLLVYTGARWPEVFEYGHLYVAPLVVLTATLGLWVHWANRANHASRP